MPPTDQKRYFSDPVAAVAAEFGVSADRVITVSDGSRAAIAARADNPFKSVSELPPGFVAAVAENRKSCGCGGGTPGARSAKGAAPQSLSKGGAVKSSKIADSRGSHSPDSTLRSATAVRDEPAFLRDGPSFPGEVSLDRSLPPFGGTTPPAPPRPPVFHQRPGNRPVTAIPELPWHLRPRVVMQNAPSEVLLKNEGHTRPLAVIGTPGWGLLPSSTTFPSLLERIYGGSGQGPVLLEQDGTVKPATENEGDTDEGRTEEETSETNTIGDPAAPTRETGTNKGKEPLPPPISDGTRGGDSPSTEGSHPSPSDSASSVRDPIVQTVACDGFVIWRIVVPFERVFFEGIAMDGASPVAGKEADFERMKTSCGAGLPPGSPEKQDKDQEACKIQSANLAHWLKDQGKSEVPKRPKNYGDTVCEAPCVPVETSGFDIVVESCLNECGGFPGVFFHRVTIKGKINFWWRIDCKEKPPEAVSGTTSDPGDDEYAGGMGSAVTDPPVNPPDEPPEDVELNCCCEVLGLAMFPGSIRGIQRHRSRAGPEIVGHDFRIEIPFRLLPVGSAPNCVFEWWEKFSHVPTSLRGIDGIEANKWIDLAGPGIVDRIAGLQAIRDAMKDAAHIGCEGDPTNPLRNRSVTLTDLPGVGLRAGSPNRFYERKLYIVVRAFSSCPEGKNFCVAIRQIIKIDRGGADTRVKGQLVHKECAAGTPGRAPTDAEMTSLFASESEQDLGDLK